MRSLQEAISEVARELQVRQRIYDRWIQDGRLDEVDAKDRLERLAAALTYLRRQAESAAAEDPRVTSSGDKPVEAHPG